MITAREIAVKVLADVERLDSYSNLAADSRIKDAGLSKLDSALAVAIIYGVLQRRLTLLWVLKSVCDKGVNKIHPFVLNVLIVGVYQILFMDKIPQSAAVNESVNIIKKSKQRFAAGFVNAVLRKVARQKDAILKEIDNSNDFEVKYSCPKELAKSFVDDYGIDNATNFLASSLKAPKTFARVNASKISLDELIVVLNEKGIDVEKCGLDGAFVLKSAGNIEHLEEFKKGLFYIQDLASQIAISSLDIKPKMRVLDVCAAPGGKSFTAATFLDDGGKVVSCDIYNSRTKLIEDGAKRLGLNVDAFVNDATVYNENLGLFDRVICDVPCSGFGVIRRKPEIKYKDINSFEALRDIQLKILETSVNYLKSNGLLMYSTCTLRRAENEVITNLFLSNHSDFEVVSSRTLMPHTDCSDGFYFCIFKRK